MLRSSRIVNLSRVLWVAALFSTWYVTYPIPADYQRARDDLIHAEQHRRIGGTGCRLSGQEKLVDRLLLQEKRQLVERARLHGEEYPGVRNFLLSSARMRNLRNTSAAYNIIQRMPKGGVLHLHYSSMTPIDWLVKNVTHRDHCYMCVTTERSVKFHFFQSPPSDSDCAWRPVRDFRSEYGDDVEFDRLLHSNITMVTDDPAKTYPDGDAAWRKFMHYFDKVEGLMLYAPVYEDYLYEGLLLFRQDNVQYVEIRGTLQPVYELDRTVHDKDWILDLYKKTATRFTTDYPDFGVKFINVAYRSQTKAAMLEDIQDAMRFHQRDPDFVVGFDVVFHEDVLNPLSYYVDELLYPSRQDPPVHLPYFFHASETNWQETQVDYNLLDAILLNTTRIGHGYGLTKHPLLLKMVREKNIAVEVNPLSNQVLHLVDDLRNHPAAALIAENFPLVISSDDPAAWEAKPLTDDFYVTFMALTGEDAGLATLKQLAKNSLIHSAMRAEEKTEALALWEQKWDDFITTTVAELNLVLDGPVVGK